MQVINRQSQNYFIIISTDGQRPYNNVYKLNTSKGQNKYNQI